MITITIKRKHVYLIATFVVIAALLIPTRAWATHQFNDVENSDWYHSDVDWLKNAGVTQGCGDGSNYCPEDFVTRGEIAAFMRRLAEKQVVDAKEVNGGTAWMWSDLASPSFNVPFTASPTYAYNSEGASIKYTRRNVGQYEITFPGWGAIGQVQVTGYDTPYVSCQTRSWGDGVVNIACYDRGGFQDTRFSILILGN